MACIAFNSYRSDPDDASSDSQYSELIDSFPDQPHTPSIVHEGIVHKVNTKSSTEQTIERWGRLTPSTFHIFRSKVAEIVTSRPLESIPLNSIISFTTYTRSSVFYLSLIHI